MSEPPNPAPEVQEEENKVVGKKKKYQNIVYDFVCPDESARLFLHLCWSFTSTHLMSETAVTTLDNEWLWQVAIFLSSICIHMTRSNNCKFNNGSDTSALYLRTPIYIHRDKIKLFGGITKEPHTAFVELGVTYHPIRYTFSPDGPEFLEKFEAWKDLVVDNMEIMLPEFGEMAGQSITNQQVSHAVQLRFQSWMVDCELKNLDSASFLGWIRLDTEPYFKKTGCMEQIVDNWVYTPYSNHGKSVIIWSKYFVRISVEFDDRSRTAIYTLEDDKPHLISDLTGNSKPEYLTRNEWVRRLLLAIQRVVRRPAVFVNICSDPLIGETFQKVTEIVRVVEREVILCHICMERPKDRVWNCGHTYCKVCTNKVIVCSICRKHKQFDLPMFT